MELLGARPAREVPVHRLRFNDSVRAPAAYLVIDTETDQEQQELVTTHQLRLWAARRRIRREVRGKPMGVTDWHGRTAAELAECVELATVGCPSLWVYAHNISFDLVTSRLPLHLVERGWRVTRLAVTGDSPWLRLSKGRKHLTLVDSWGWLRRPLEDIGQAVGVAKLELPDNAAGAGEWLARCQVDVEILDRALSELMGWWEQGQLGVWSLTGSATGWNAMRHHRVVDRMVIDPNPEAMARDRRAVYGGRRETWWIGESHRGAWVDMDFRHAYPQVAARLPLPKRRWDTFTHLPPDHPWVGGNSRGIIAAVRLRTDTPRWPVRWCDQVFYPVGEFSTVLADPEIVEARRLGCLLEIGAGEVHQLGLALQPWAVWVLNVEDGLNPDAPMVARMACHGWGRSVIGKWAQRSFSTMELGPSPIPGWGVEEGTAAGTGRKAAMVDLGGRRWHVRSDQEGENAYPAVLAWVESHVRLRLSRALEAIGDTDLAQCDTDGLIIEKWAAALLDCHPELTWPLGLRRKRTITRLGLWGPQHLQTDGRNHFAGISSRAREVEPGRFTVRGWPKLAWQMGHGSTAGYLQPEMEYRLRGPYTHRWVLANGRTLPVMAAGSAQEPFQPLPWPSDPRAASSGPLAPQQHPLLAELAYAPPAPPLP